MYKLEIYLGVDLVKTLSFVKGEENELRDYVARYELDGCKCRLWKESIL